jgi:hypothetical protein
MKMEMLPVINHDQITMMIVVNEDAQMIDTIDDVHHLRKVVDHQVLQEKNVAHPHRRHHHHHPRVVDHQVLQE